MDFNVEQEFGILRHIRYEIESFFLVPKLCKTCAAGLDVQESILFRRIGHCRILREFFTQKDRFSDNALAQDFSFAVCTPKELFSGNVIANKVDECFNKRLFHLTYSRLSASEEKWCTDKAFPPIEAKSKAFVKHIIEMLANKFFASPSVSPEMQAQELLEWKQLEGKIESEQRPDLFAGTSNVASSVLTPIVFRT